MITKHRVMAEVEADGLEEKEEKGLSDRRREKHAPYMQSTFHK